MVLGNINITDIKLLLVGYSIYWLTTLSVNFRQNSNTFTFLGFVKQNSIEMIIGLLSCYAINLLAPTIPKELIDVSTPLSMFMVGYSNNSILSKIISFRKNGNTPTTAKQSP